MVPTLPDDLRRSSAVELDGITSAPLHEPGLACSIAPLIVAGIIGAGAAAAGGGTALALNKRYSPTMHDIDESAYQDEHGAQTRNELIRKTAAAENRDAPQTTAAYQSGIREATGANIGGNERSNTVNVGSAAQGTAAQGSAASIARGEDQQARSMQMTLAQKLADQGDGKGPSLAAGQLRQATDRNIAQQHAAAAAGGGNPALAARNAQNVAAQLNRQAASDSAQVRMQEQMAARQQLAGVLDSTRGQDIGVNTSQAGFNQQMGLANMDAQNRFGLANMDARNQFALEQARLSQQNNQFNAGQTNATSLAQAQLNQQANLASQAQYNEMLARNTQNTQQVNLANMEAELRQQGLNDEQVRAMMQMRMAQNEADRQAAMAHEQLEVEQTIAREQIGAKAHEAQAGRTQSALGGMFGGVGSAIGGMFSDPRSKEGIQSLVSGYALEGMGNAASPGVPTNSGMAGMLGKFLSSDAGQAAMSKVMSDPQSKDAMKPLSTWGTGEGKVPEAPKMPEPSNRAQTSDELRKANNHAIFTETKQAFDAEQKAEDTARDQAKIKAMSAQIEKAGQMMGSAPAQAAGPDYAMRLGRSGGSFANYLSQFRGGR